MELRPVTPEDGDEYMRSPIDTRTCHALDIAITALLVTIEYSAIKKPSA